MPLNLNRKPMLKNAIILVAIISFFASSWHANAEKSNEHTLVLPETVSFNYLQDMVWGNGQYVAVGKNGLVMTTPDGVTWTTRRWLDTDDLKAVAWGAGKYIAVGTLGLVLISQDGITWEETTSAPLKEWVPTRIRFVDGAFYLIARQYTYDEQVEINTMFSSIDGVNWSLVLNTPKAVSDIAGGDGQRVIVTRNGVVYRSIGNGEWQPTILKQMGDRHRGGQNNHVIWNGQKYVASVEGTLLASSSDGISWDSKKFGRVFDELVWNGNKFIAVCGVGVATSTDGNEWFFANIMLNGVATGPMNTIAGSSGKTLISNYSGYQGGPVFLVSEDDLSWKGLSRKDNIPKLGDTITYRLKPTEIKYISEKEELEQEENQRKTSENLIGFAMSGLSPLLYVIMQIVALKRAVGVWRLFAWLPCVGVVPLTLATIIGLWQGSNLWPLGVIFLLPIAISYLLLFILVHWVFLNANRQKRE